MTNLSVVNEVENMPEEPALIKQFREVFEVGEKYNVNEFEQWGIDNEYIICYLNPSHPTKAEMYYRTYQRNSLREKVNNLSYKLSVNGFYIDVETIGETVRVKELQSYRNEKKRNFAALEGLRIENRVRRIMRIISPNKNEFMSEEEIKNLEIFKDNIHSLRKRFPKILKSFPKPGDI